MKTRKVTMYCVCAFGIQATTYKYTLQEALEYIKWGLAQPKYHRSINSAKSRIDSLSEDESKKKEEIFKFCEKRQQFISKHGLNILLNKADNFIGTWHNPNNNCMLTIEQIDKESLSVTLQGYNNSTYSTILKQTKKLITINLFTEYQTILGISSIKFLIAKTDNKVALFIEKSSYSFDIVELTPKSEIA